MAREQARTKRVVELMRDPLLEDEPAEARAGGDDIGQLACILPVVVRVLWAGKKDRE
jgi:hypothetical protein